MSASAELDTVADSVRSLDDAVRHGRIAEALAQLDGLDPAIRTHFDIMAREADLLGRIGEHEAEIGLYEKLIAMRPGSASVRLSLANALKTVGRVDEAVTAVREAIALQPAYGKAWWLLADLKNFQFSEADVAAMTEALGGAPGDADRLHLHFALGRAEEQIGNHAAAFTHYARGNALRAAALPPGAMSVGPRVDRLTETLTADFFARRAGQGAASRAPIFILGLHRSGSTLVEQILASHPEIEATSELPVLNQLFRAIGQDDSLPGADPIAKMASLDAARLRELGEAYLDRAQAYRRTDRPFFTDKMPANWLHVGFIRLILPNARIVDARRHPMAAGLSNFRQNYGAGAAWSFNLAAIGHYYRDYLRLMARIDAVQPGAVHRVINERLIDDFEPEVRRLLDYVGVPFDPACLDFHRGKRPVRSASAEQVRRPINRDGIDQWRAFEPWLGELKTALGPALEEWDRP